MLNSASISDIARYPAVPTSKDLIFYPDDNNLPGNKKREKKKIEGKKAERRGILIYKIVNRINIRLKIVAYTNSTY